MITPWRKRSAFGKAIISILGLFLVVIFCLATYYKGLIVGLQTVGTFIGLPLTIVGIVIGTALLALGIHELGHVAAGKLVGLQFYMMRVGPFSWVKRAKGIRFSIEKSGQLTGGFAAMGPTDSRNLLNRHRLFISGGPLASLAFLALVIFVIPWPEAHSAKAARGNEEALARLAVILLELSAHAYAVLYAVSSVIPLRYRGFYNDAAQLLLPIFDKKQAEYRVLAWKWSAEFSSGKRCADWDREALRELKSRATSPFEKASFSHCLGNSLLYIGQIEEGLVEMEEAFTYLTKPTKLLVEYECGIALDTAFARAYFARDLEPAKLAYAKAEAMNTKLNYGHHRALAAISLLEGNNQRCEMEVKKALAWLDENAESEKPIVQAAYEEMALLRASSMS